MLTMGTTERRKYDCQSWAGEDIVTSVLLALGVFTLIVCCKNTQAAHGNGSSMGDDLRPPTNNEHDVSTPVWKGVLQPQSSLQLTVAPPNSFTATLQGLLGKNHQIKPLSDS